jgi:NADH-quinone oxidoreductase subunit L
VLAPLVGAIVAGLFGGASAAPARMGHHRRRRLSAVLSLAVLVGFMWLDLPVFNGTVYTWMVATACASRSASWSTG